MSTGTKTQRYKLVGPHAGKTMTVNNHQFEDGEYAFHGSPEQIAGLTRAFSFYAALPIEQAELEELRAEKEAAELQATKDAETNEGETDEGSADEGAADEGETDEGSADEGETDEGSADEGEATKLSLAEAIGQLNGNDDAHWTSNNLPSLEYLATLLGKTPTRAEVNAIAEGYTRAKAKAAQQ